jgi:glycosyltransferase involved in cell wall biosynthesis
VLERYDDPRIRRFFHDENLSLSRRLNEGAAAAKGEFVAILYSDDWMLPDKLERQCASSGRSAPNMAWSIARRWASTSTPA